MLSRFAPNDRVPKEFKTHPLTMRCFIKRTRKCTKLFFNRYFASMCICNVLW